MTKISTTIDMSDTVAVVTGGTRGIGRAISETLAKAGANVVPTSRTKSDVEDAAERIRDLGSESLTMPTDVTDTTDVATLFETVAKELGSVDILVNNAGINPVSAMGNPETVDPEEFQSALRVNLQGAFICTHEAGEFLLDKNGGCIVNIASVSGLVGTKQQHSYVASKHGVVGLTKSTALDWAPKVRVNAIAPGYVSTVMTEPIKESKGLYESILSDVPVDRFADPEEIAGAALFLASDMASYITGECMVVDGGWTAK